MSFFGVRIGPSSRIALRLWAAQYGRCGICGGRIRQLSVLTNDHVVPKARGGGNLGNRVAAHALCNLSKSDRMPTGCELIWLAVANDGLVKMPRPSGGAVAGA